MNVSGLNVVMIAGLLWLLSHLRIAGCYLLSAVTSSCFVSHRDHSNSELKKISVQETKILFLNYFVQAILIMDYDTHWLYTERHRTVHVHLLTSWRIQNQQY